MIAVDSWLKYLAARRPSLPDKAYWVLFSLSICSAAAMRVFWIYVLQIPFVTPDTHSYVNPIMNHWLLPLSQFRTAGTPMILSASLAIFRHPAGILIVNGILAIGSAALLAVAIKNVLRLKVLSLIVLLLVTYTAKNISFEYYLMSEHYSRVFYVVYAALTLWMFQNPARLWIAALVGVSVIFNILVKPSAVVLIVATLIALIAGGWYSRHRRRQIAAATGVFLATVVVTLTAYMLEFRARYGTFSLTHAEGINLFSHVGHLTLLDGGKHPDLKKQLKPLLERYAANYAAKGHYEPNWLIFGSFNDQLRADFGDRSPSRAVAEYVRERYPADQICWSNQIYRDLAIEGILAHPAKYLGYAANRAYVLWKGGYSFLYYVFRPSVETLQSHRDDRTIQRNWYYALYGEVPPCSAGPVVPARASGPLVELFHGPIADCDPLPYEDPAVQKAAAWVDRIYRRVVAPVQNHFVDLAFAGAASAVMAGVMLLWFRERRALYVYAFGLLLALVLLGYTMFHGLINVAETQRMAMNVQDYVVVGSLAFLTSALMSVKRLLLYAIVLRQRRKTAAPA